MNGMNKIAGLSVMAIGMIILFATSVFAISYGLTPADNEWTTNATSGISFSYNRTANLNGSVTCDLLVDVGQTSSFVVANESTTCTNDTIYAVTSGVSISEGLTNWKVRAFNGTAEETSSVKTIKVDRTAPTITVNTGEGAYFNTSTASLNFTPSDNVGTLNCTVFVSGVANNISVSATNNTPYIAYAYSQGEGAHNWSARCQDQSGNITNTNLYNITVDTAVPDTVTISAPVTNTWISTGTFTLTAKYTDLIAATANCSAYVDGALWVSQTADNNTNEDFTITPSPEEGNHSVYVTCRDGALNANSSTTIYVPIDKTAPTVNFVLPANGTINANTTYNFYWNYTDTLDAVTECNVTIDDTIILNYTAYNNTNNVSTKASLAQGNHTWYVNCTDDSGKVGTTNKRWFMVDTDVPATVTISSPVTNTWRTSTTYTLTAKYTDLLSANASCAVYVGGIRWTAQEFQNNTNTDSIVTPSGEGNWSTYVNCTDNAGNSNISATIYVPIDTVTPTVLVNGTGSPANGTIASATGYTFNFTYSDTLDGSIGCNLTIDDTIIINKTVSNYTYTTQAKTGLSDGNHTWYLNCTDDSGRVGNSGTRWFVVDTTGASASFAVYNYTGATAMTGKINITLTDTYRNVSNCYVNIYHPNGSVTNMTISKSGSGTATMYCSGNFNYSDIYGAGQIDFEVVANDTLGNVAKTNSSSWMKIDLHTGWNLVQVPWNTTIGVFNLTGTVSYVAYFNNTGKNFTTWTAGTATNQNQTIKDVDSVFVYSTSESYMLVKWSVDTPNATSGVASLTAGANQMSHFNTSAMTLEEICKLPLDNSTEVNATFTTWINNTGSYVSHFCGFTLYGNESIPRGRGNFIFVNGTTNLNLTRV